MRRERGGRGRAVIKTGARRTKHDIASRGTGDLLIAMMAYMTADDRLSMCTRDGETSQADIVLSIRADRVEVRGSRRR